MFTINKCSLGWVVRMMNANGKTIDEATFRVLDDACDYVKHLAWHTV